MNLKILNKPYIPLILLVAFYFLWSANLVRFTFQAVDYDPQNELGLFQSESAFQYRYARLVAQGKPIPDLDLAAQVPEGLKTRQVILTLMDEVAGRIYRWWAPATVPFHLYIIYFVAFFSTLTVFPLYFLLGKLWGKPWVALFTTAAYAMTFAVYGRSLGGYLHENFALPFLFLFLAAFYWAVNQPKDLEGKPSKKFGGGLMAAGIGLLVALASWHLSQFFFTAFCASLFLSSLWYWKEIKDSAGAKNLLYGFFTLLPFMVLAGLALPTLRYQGFLLSPAVIFCLSFSAFWAVGKIKSKTKYVLGGLVLLAAVTGLYFSSPYGGEYSHVYDLLYYKLRFLGQKPADPSLLSYDARVFWTAGFDTPKLKDLVWHYNLLLPLGLGGLALYLYRNWKQRENPAISVLLLMTFMFLFLSFLLLRMGVFLTFLLALFIPCWWGNVGALNLTPLPPRRQKALKWIGVLSLAALLGFQLFFAAAFKFDKRPRQENFMLQWIVRQTPPSAAFLAPLELSPQILTYTGRPIVLHSMFEEKGIREKNRLFLEALYGTEEDLYRYCRQNKAGYLLYQTFLLLDTSSDSNRYVAAKMKLMPDSAAFRLHFKEKDLQYFQLVFQEGPFRLYKIKEAKAPDKGLLPDAPTLVIYSPFFNPANFNLTPETTGIEPVQIKRGMQKIDQFQEQIKLADDFLRKKIYNTSLFHLDLAEKTDPGSPLPHYLRALVYLQQNKKEPARQELTRALEKNPQYIYARELLGKLK